MKWNLHKTKLSQPKLGHSATAINKNQIIINGGATAYKNIIDSPTSYSGLFDISSGSLIQLPDMVTERLGHSSVVLNNYLYILGGVVNKSVHRMNLSKIIDKSSSSTLITSNIVWETDIIPEYDQIRVGAAAVVYNDYIYVFGGSGHPSSFSSCIRYRPSGSSNPTENWEIIGFLNKGRFGHAAINVAGKIYVLGGRDEEGYYLDSMEIYDPSKNKFLKSGPRLPIPLDKQSVVSIGKYIVVHGGITTKGEINEKILLFDTHRQVWESYHSSSTNIQRIMHATTVMQGDKIVVCGGYDTNTIEWISFDELLFGKRWDRRKQCIILRCLVERGRASSSETTPSRPEKIIEFKNKRNNKRERFRRSRSGTWEAVKEAEIHEPFIRHLIQNTDNDVFRLVLKFL